MPKAVSAKTRVKVELSVWQELKRGLYCVEQAGQASDGQLQMGFLRDAKKAHEKALELIAQSPTPMTNLDVQEKLRQLTLFLKANLAS